MVDLTPIMAHYGDAETYLRSRCTVERNDGGSWYAVASAVPCSIRHRQQMPVPFDVVEATPATAEMVTVRVPVGTPSRPGDHLFLDDAPLRRWSIGGGDWTQDYLSYLSLEATRPTAATPRVAVIMRRLQTGPGGQNGQRDFLAAQTVQIVLSSRQPRVIGQATYMEGTVFRPEDLSPLNAEIGDQFLYANRLATIIWITPDPAQRREATFRLSVPTVA